MSLLPGRSGTLVMAHRGSTALLPENSLAAFQLALDEGADAIETDLRVTADGVVVCVHDATTERTTGEPRRVGDLTLAQVRRLRLRDRAGRLTAASIPTLDEVLDLVPPTVALALELKDSRLVQEPHVGPLAHALRERVAARTLTAVSFSLRRLLVARERVPGLPIGPISTLAPFPWQPGELVGPYWPLLRLNPWYVAAAHRRGKAVCPLDPALDERLGGYLRAGVDAVLSDSPGATRKQIESLRRA